MKAAPRRALGSCKVVPLGDKAVLVDICATVDLEVNLDIQRLAKAIQLRRPHWVRDVVPALGSLALHLDNIADRRYREHGSGLDEMGRSASVVLDWAF